MEYEPDYSKSQIHFVTQPPEWLPLLDSERQFDSIIDLGAGGGRNSVFLRKLYPAANLIALDLSMVRCAACRQVVDAGVICGDSMQMPIASGSFDLVISTQVIEHVPDDCIFIQEIARILRPGGFTLVSSVVRMRFGWYFYRNHMGDRVLDPTHVQGVEQRSRVC